MKRKIISILVMTMLISVTGIAIADWEEGEDFKMHYPQLPDPYGVDVDWHVNWSLGDDWMCTENGSVDDIHFWISWYDDIPKPIPWIDVSIWSNNPAGPSGWSEPLDQLWERRIYDGQFIIAGPWNGDQEWMMPWGDIIPPPHYLYWQINIKNIDDPFDQIAGEIYWLVIKMPFYQKHVGGWKNTQDYFMDHAVWSYLPGEYWDMIAGIDFAFVITGGEPCNPSIDVEKYVLDKDGNWVDADTQSQALEVVICTEIKYKIVITNTGDCPIIDLTVLDKMHESLEFISSIPNPDDQWSDPPDYYMEWHIPRLEVNQTKEIIITAHVVGKPCSYDYNHVNVTGTCIHGKPVSDEDWCWIHCKEKTREINRSFLNFLQNHPNLFIILRLLLQRLRLQ